MASAILGAVSMLLFDFNLSSFLLSSTRDRSPLPPAYLAGHLPMQAKVSTPTSMTLQAKMQTSAGASTVLEVCVFFSFLFAFFFTNTYSEC